MERIASAGGDLVIPDVAQADQGEGPGKGAGAIRVARPELPEDGDERRPAEGVDLVYEEDEGPGYGPGPGVERRAEEPATFGLWPGRGLELLRQAGGRTGSPVVEDRALGGTRVVLEGGSDLGRDDDRGVCAVGGQLARELEDGRRLAGLSRGVEDEVCLLYTSDAADE